MKSKNIRIIRYKLVDELIHNNAYLKFINMLNNKTSIVNIVNTIRLNNIDIIKFLS